MKQTKIKVIVEHIEYDRDEIHIKISGLKKVEEPMVTLQTFNTRTRTAYSGYSGEHE